VVLWRQGGQVLWGHSGDSRLYQFRDGRVLFQTKDHSVPQMLVGSGEITFDEIRTHEDRNRLLRALGTPGPVKATLVKEAREACPGDTFLLCSDGFWEPVLEADMEAALATHPEPAAWLAALEGPLRRRLADDDDNYSALAVTVR
jgi:serine/threonine protein phosphatase PrpC